MNQATPNTWTQLTLQGNALFERGEHLRAILAYEQARSLALACFNDWPDGEDAVAAVVVSTLNLAEAQARAGALDEAAELLASVHASLLRASRNAGLHVSLRDAATRHLRETQAALLRFEAQHGAHAELRRCLCPDCYAELHASPYNARTLH